MEAYVNSLAEELMQESVFHKNMQMLQERMAMESKQRRSDKEWELGKTEEMRQKKTSAIRDLARGTSEADIDSRLGQAEEAYKAAGMADKPEVQAALADARSRNKGGLLFSPSSEEMMRAEADYEGDYKGIASLEAQKANNAEMREQRAAEAKERRDFQREMQGERLAARGGGGGSGKPELSSAEQVGAYYQKRKSEVLKKIDTATNPEERDALKSNLKEIEAEYQRELAAIDLPPKARTDKDFGPKKPAAEVGAGGTASNAKPGELSKEKATAKQESPRLKPRGEPYLAKDYDGNPVMMQEFINIGTGEVVKKRVSPQMANPIRKF
jgi:hypothetical protein